MDIRPVAPVVRTFYVRPASQLPPLPGALGSRTATGFLRGTLKYPRACHNLLYEPSQKAPPDHTPGTCDRHWLVRTTPFTTFR